MAEMIRQSEKWSHDYSMRPYLRDKSEAYVYERRDYLMDTVLTLTPDGKIGVLQDHPMWEAITHLQLELSLRGRNLADEDHPLKKPKFLEFFDNPSVPKITHGELFRFSQRKYLEPLINTGRLRLAPASSYKDSALITAIQDDELRKRLVAHPGDVEINLYIRETGEHVRIRNTAELNLDIDAGRDYYLLCMTARYLPRLWFDFDESDTCLVVNHKDEFLRRINDATKSQLPGWEMIATDVKYMDPHLGSNDDLQNVHIGKHVLYAYQQEFRILWKSDSVDPKKPLDVTHLELGPLNDICELIYFS